MEPGLGLLEVAPCHPCVRVGPWHCIAGAFIGAYHCKPGPCTLLAARRHESGQGGGQKHHPVVVAREFYALVGSPGFCVELRRQADRARAGVRQVGLKGRQTGRQVATREGCNLSGVCVPDACWWVSSACHIHAQMSFSHLPSIVVRRITVVHRP